MGAVKIQETRYVPFKKNPFFSRYGKYNNALRQKCSLGHSHRSRLESQYCFKLTIMKKRKEIIDFEFEKRYELRVNGKLICHHKPDFTLIMPNGKVFIHETKGLETDRFKLVHKLFEACYPDIPYIIVK